MSISSRLPRRFSLFCTLGLLLPVLGSAAPVGELRSPASRDLQQMRESAERYRMQDEVEQMQERRRELESREAPQAPAKEDESGLHFELKGIEHDKSLILTDEEIAQAVEPFIGREVGMKDVRDLLEAVNALYREKGYVVCEARLKPQRIRNGVLFVTLIEGRTGKVSVTGAEHTREGYVLDAFDLAPGEVANYREMSEDLVWFNMTNDVVLSIDIRAGEEPGTTDYEIAAREPANWTATVFADTTGTRSTGRPRAGASVTNRSLFGRRDSATVLGIASEGSKSAMVSYSLPLTSRGTRLTASASWGKGRIANLGKNVYTFTQVRRNHRSWRLSPPILVWSLNLIF